MDKANKTNAAENVGGMEPGSSNARAVRDGVTSASRTLEPGRTSTGSRSVDQSEEVQTSAPSPTTTRTTKTSRPRARGVVKARKR